MKNIYTYIIGYEIIIEYARRDQSHPMQKRKSVEECLFIFHIYVLNY